MFDGDGKEVKPTKESGEDGIKFGEVLVDGTKQVALTLKNLGVCEAKNIRLRLGDVALEKNRRDKATGVGLDECPDTLAPEEEKPLVLSWGPTEDVLRKGDSLLCDLTVSCKYVMVRKEKTGE